MTAQEMFDKVAKQLLTQREDSTAADDVEFHLLLLDVMARLEIPDNKQQARGCVMLLKCLTVFTDTENRLSRLAAAGKELGLNTSVLVREV